MLYLICLIYFIFMFINQAECRFRGGGARYSGSRYSGSTSRYSGSRYSGYSRYSPSLYSSTYYRMSTYRTSYRSVATRYSRAYSSWGYTYRYYSYYRMYFIYPYRTGYYAYRGESNGASVCANYEADKNGTALGLFTCPMPFEPDSFTYCCGDEDAEYCCEFIDASGPRAGLAISCILLFIMIILILVVIRLIISHKKKTKINPHRPGAPGGGRAPPPGYQNPPPRGHRSGSLPPLYQPGANRPTFSNPSYDQRPPSYNTAWSTAPAFPPPDYSTTVTSTYAPAPVPAEPAPVRPSDTHQ